jgi:hypothetical protein
MKIRFVSFVLLLFIAVPGCIVHSLVPFTNRHVDEFEAYLRNLQYYTSEIVVFKREIESEEKSVINRTHRIRIERNKKILEITIPKNTPGVLRKIEGNTIYVQFEPDQEGYDITIPFTKAVLQDFQADPGYGAKYAYVFNAEKIQYAGKEYSVFYLKEEVPVSTDKGGKKKVDHYVTKMFYPHLMVYPVELVDLLDKDKRTVKGLRLEDVSESEE